MLVIFVPSANDEPESEALPVFMQEAFGWSIFRHCVSKVWAAKIDEKILFVYYENEIATRFIRAECQALGMDAKTISLAPVHRRFSGELEAIMAGIKAGGVPRDERIFISSVDAIRTMLRIPESLDLMKIDGFVEVTEQDRVAHRRVVTSDLELLKRIGHSPLRRIGKQGDSREPFVTGFYYFRTRDILTRAYRNLSILFWKKKPNILQVINYLLKDKQDIFCVLAESDSIYFLPSGSEVRKFANTKYPNMIKYRRYYTEAEFARLATNISEKNFLSFLRLINSAGEGAIEKFREHIISFLDRYASYERLISLGYAHRSEHGGEELLQGAYERIYDPLLRLLTVVLDDQKNPSKAMTVLAFLILIYGKKAIEDVDSSNIKAAFRELSLDRHKYIFRALRADFTPRAAIDRFFDLDFGGGSISYFFVAFCIALSIKENERLPYLSSIRKRLPALRVQLDGDRERLQILTYYLREGKPGFAAGVGKSEKGGSARTGVRSQRRIAMLVSGQLRNSKFTEGFRSNYLESGDSAEVFVSTWNIRGAAPCRLSSLRGYEPAIRKIIQRMAFKHGIAAKAFLDVYHMSSGDIVTNEDISKNFSATWSEVDVEGETTPEFSDNQERMFYKIHKAFEASRNSGIFDAYIRMRPDVSFVADKAEIDAAIDNCSKSPKVIYLKKSRFYDVYIPYVDDNLAIMGKDAAKIYAYLWSQLQRSAKSMPFDLLRGNIVPHSSLAYWLLMNNVEIRYLETIREWRYNSVADISAKDYIPYLKGLSRKDVNRSFVSELLTALDTK